MCGFLSIASVFLFGNVCVPVKMTTTPPLSSYVPLQGEIGRPGSKVKHPSPPRLYNLSPSLHLSLDLSASAVASDVISLSVCSQARSISLSGWTT